MARSPAKPQQHRPQSFQQRTHEDFGAINERLSGAERGIERLSADFANLSNSLSQQIGDLAKTFNENSRTNLLPILSALIPAAAGVGALAWAFLAPVATQTAENEKDLKSVLQTRFSREDAQTMSKSIYESLNRKYEDVERQIEKLATKEQLADEEKLNTEIFRRIDEKIAILRSQSVTDLARVDSEIGMIETTFERRSEGQQADATNAASLERVSRNLEDVRKRLGDDFTLGDTIKSLERRIEKLSEENRTPIVAPLAPIAPLAPVAPPKAAD